MGIHYSFILLCTYARESQLFESQGASMTDFCEILLASDAAKAFLLEATEAIASSRRDLCASSAVYTLDEPESLDNNA